LDTGIKHIGTPDKRLPTLQISSFANSHHSLGSDSAAVVLFLTCWFCYCFWTGRDTTEPTWTSELLEAIW